MRAMMRMLVVFGTLTVSSLSYAAYTVADFKTTFDAKNYEKAFDILIHLRSASKNPIVFHKLLGVVSYHLGGHLYAMMLLEEYLQRVQKAPEAIGNFAVVSQEMQLGNYVVDAFYEDFLTMSTLPESTQTIIAPELVLEAMGRNELARAQSFLAPLRGSRTGLLVGGIFAQFNDTPNIAQDYLTQLISQPIRSGEEYRLKLLAHINLARIYYEEKQFAQSLHHYGRIPRSFDLWPQVLIESAWAHLQQGELNLALGKVHGFISPFFLTRIYPEALLLRSMALLELCKYSEMAITLGYLTKAYRPLAQELRKKTGQTPSPETLQTLMSEIPENVDLPKPLTHHLLTHENTRHTRERLDKIQANSDISLRLAKLASPRDREQLARYIDHVSQFVMQRYGQFVQREIQSSYTHVQKKLEEARLMEIEMTIGQQEAIEKIEEVVQKSREASEIVAIVKPGHEFWRFHQEWWLDEMGYYYVNTPSSCVSATAP